MTPEQARAAPLPRDCPPPQQQPLSGEEGVARLGLPSLPGACRSALFGSAYLQSVLQALQASVHIPPLLLVATPGSPPSLGRSFSRPFLGHSFSFPRPLYKSFIFPS